MGSISVPNVRNVVGRPVPRVDALEKARGKCRYAGDLSMPGMLHARVLLSDRVSARITRIDAARARALAGVTAVITAGDVPGLGGIGIIDQDQPVLVGVGGEVRFTGDAVALVAAASKEVAEQALGLVEVDYEDLPGLYTIDEALRSGARRLHADRPGNICIKVENRFGDPDRAFDAADVVVEEIYDTPRQEHAFMEPEAGLAYVDNRGHLTINSCTQDPYHHLRDVSRALRLPMNKLRISSPAVGGGFGAKLDVTIQHWLGLLALKTGRPVKMVLDREESVRIHAKRHPMRITIKIGANAAGRILALSANVLTDAGAYTNRTPNVLRGCLRSAPGPYDIPNLRLEGRAVFTNNPVSGAFRGYGAPQTVLAREVAIDVLARRLGVDPVQLRLENGLQAGHNSIGEGIEFDSPVSLPRVMAEMVERAGPAPRPRNEHEVVGRGVALDMPTHDTGASPGVGMNGVGAAVEMFQDGSVTVYSTAVEIGQGLATVLAQIAAEVFGLDVRDVAVVLGDTDVAPKAGPTSGSRQTYVSGNAVLIATRNIRERLLARASRALEIDVRDLAMAGGSIFPADGSGRKMELSHLAATCFNEGIALREEVWFRPDHGPSRGYSFLATLADVAVDTLTGEVTLRKAICSADVGTAINPHGVEGQIHGGTVQSQGYTLMEDLVCQDGLVRNLSLSQYLIPTAMDAPAEMAAVIVEEPSPTGPFGARGVGEHIMRTVPPAILNALRNATGTSFRKIPLHPQEVLQAIGGGE